MKGEAIITWDPSWEEAGSKEEKVGCRIGKIEGAEPFSSSGSLVNRARRSIDRGIPLLWCMLLLSISPDECDNLGPESSSP